MPRKITVLSALAACAALALAGAGCNLLSKNPAAPQPVTLEYWRLDDEADALAETVAAYQKLHPHIDVKITRVDATDYERLLLEAFAENRGPDLFNVNNVDLPAWRGKLAPLPSTTAIPKQVVDANRKVVWSNPKTASLTVREVKDTFVEAVAQDAIWKAPSESDPKVSEDRIFGLAYSMDTPVIFYNRDLLRQANLAEPPATWGDFQQQAARLTVLDNQGGIVQSGAAIGGGENVRYAADVLLTLMGQNGSDMTGTTRLSIDKRALRAETKPVHPTLEVLAFWQSFATPGGTAYTWNAQMPSSLDAFVQGKTAMFFGLPRDRDLVRERSPRLDFGMAPLPQIETTAKYAAARYPVEVVAKSSAHQNEAWSFLQFAARAENVAKTLEKTRRPAAARALVSGQTSDPDLAAFASQALTARTWYRGYDFAVAEKAVAQLIAFRPDERNDLADALNIYLTQVNRTYAAPKF